MANTLPRLAKFLAQVPQATAADPTATIAWQIRDTVTQVERCLGPQRQAQDRVNQWERDLRLRHCLPTPLATFECSKLLPAPADMAAVPPPDGSVSFAPVTTVTEERFADLRGFHGGQDGLLYIRTHHRAARAASGRLSFGADGPVKVWLNGEELGCEPAAINPARRDGFYRLAGWREGDNEIILALATRGGLAWGVFAGVL